MFMNITTMPVPHSYNKNNHTHTYDITCTHAYVACDNHRSLSVLILHIIKIIIILTFGKE